MSSIRPLVTITILVVVGVYLFTKINEVQVPEMPGVDGTAQSVPPVEIPPLATVPSAATTAPTTLTPVPAPQWAGPGAETAPATNLPAVADTAADPPAVPAVPELPPLTTPTETQTATSTPKPNPPIELPTNIPMARYPGESATAVVEPMTSPTTTPEAMASESTPQPPTAEAVSPVAPMTPIAAGDRYGSIPVAPAPATPISPTTEPSFAASWPEIQGSLERQELVQAHEKLSQWYGNPTLSPVEVQQVETLLSQLAGTVVYSTEHRLEPPYTVHAGDTLQTIAAQYEVPWQLLAKINGIPAAELVQPGQQLKVVHGPFSAVVELGKSQLTLMLDGRYAGRFPITAEPGAAGTEGEWVLEQKLANPSTDPTGVVSASYSTPVPVDRVLVLRSESPQAGSATISITGGATSPSGPTAVAPAAIRLAPTDAEEVADILSVGSRVTIRK